MALAKLSKDILRLVSAVPGAGADSIMEGLGPMGHDESVMNRVPNQLKLLESSGYLSWDNGWHLTEKGVSINKYGG